MDGKSQFFSTTCGKRKIIQGSQVTNGADIAEIIPHCRVKTQRANGKGLLEVAFVPELRATQDALKYILLNEGGILLKNTAPRGPLARTVIEGLGQHWKHGQQDGDTRMD